MLPYAVCTQPLTRYGSFAISAGLAKFGTAIDRV